MNHDHLPASIIDFEAHHVTSVADAGERKTKVTDLALLCATCHRLLHIIARGRAWDDR
ncbi:HNH endonuclease [Devosia sp. LjRoot16]|uniref:HNH endonuclease n=1 Tax=Devosia sp. LjRoot16 TaxID=3342271 RepID=UPI003ECCA847